MAIGKNKTFSNKPSGFVKTKRHIMQHVTSVGNFLGWVCTETNYQGKYIEV